MVSSEINDENESFVESRDMFFLSTVDHRGYPTCSYKDGNPGFDEVVDSKTQESISKLPSLMITLSQRLLSASNNGAIRAM